MRKPYHTGGPVCRPYGESKAGRPGGRALQNHKTKKAEKNGRRAATWGRLYGEVLLPLRRGRCPHRPGGTLALNIQAQQWNRNAENSPLRQAPGGAGWKRRAPLKFPRAGNIAKPNRYASPVTGSGMRDLEHRYCAPRSKDRWRFGYFAAGAAKLSYRERDNSLIAPSSVWPLAISP